MKKILRRMASRFPSWLLRELRRLNSLRQMRSGKLLSPEPEFKRLGQWVGSGDWVVDVGANVGQYTLRLSAIVGENGRVLAFEPVSQTFEILAANASRAPYSNITLFNAAASYKFGTAGMAVPRYSDGLGNFYQARMSSSPEFNVLCIPLDSLDLPHRLALVKIDAEGHDLEVLKGMRRLLAQDHPMLIVENGVKGLAAFLSEFGYASSRIEESPNLVFTAAGSLLPSTAE